MEAERRTNAFQSEVRERTRKLLAEATGSPPTDEQIADFLGGRSKIEGRRADGTVGPLDPADLHERARSDLYGERLREVADLRKRLEDPNLSAAERLEIATQINTSESQALYFAPEAYQTHASILDIVQNTQKIKADPKAYGDLVSTKVSHVVYEQIGMAMGHTGEGLDELVKLNKYADRAGAAASSYPYIVLPPKPQSIEHLLGLKKGGQLGRAPEYLLSNAKAGGDLKKAIALQRQATVDYLNQLSKVMAGVHAPSVVGKWEKLPLEEARDLSSKVLLKLAKFAAQSQAG
jgi:hypothetical protein